MQSPPMTKAIGYGIFRRRPASTTPTTAHIKSTKASTGFIQNRQANAKFKAQSSESKVQNSVKAPKYQAPSGAGVESGGADSSKSVVRDDGRRKRPCPLTRPSGTLSPQWGRGAGTPFSARIGPVARRTRAHH